MTEVSKNLFVGSQYDYEQNPLLFNEWCVVHACKEPYHRRALGYSGAGAPKNSPYYLFLYDKNYHLVMNIVDADSPRFFADELIDEAINYCITGLKHNKKVLIHCNQGESRAPMIAMMVMKKMGLLSNNFDEALNYFSSIYEYLRPKRGILEYSRARWNNL